MTQERLFSYTASCVRRVTPAHRGVGGQGRGADQAPDQGKILAHLEKPAPDDHQAELPLGVRAPPTQLATAGDGSGGSASRYGAGAWYFVNGRQRGRRTATLPGQLPYASVVTPFRLDPWYCA